MITASRRVRPGTGTAALTALIALAVAFPLSACGSGTTSTASAVAAATQSPAKQACQQVDMVLTNGPDPGADPVGYAEAQILPLRKIHTSDATLSKAIGALATAYSGYSTAGGKSKAATATLNTAIKAINALCPGAGATL
jgi:hypothetical protein